MKISEVNSCADRGEKNMAASEGNFKGRGWIELLRVQLEE